MCAASVSGTERKPLLTERGITQQPGQSTYHFRKNMDPHSVTMQNLVRLEKSEKGTGWKRPFKVAATEFGYASNAVLGVFEGLARTAVYGIVGNPVSRAIASRTSPPNQKKYQTLRRRLKSDAALSAEATMQSAASVITNLIPRRCRVVGEIINGGIAGSVSREGRIHRAQGDNPLHES